MSLQPNIFIARLAEPLEAGGTETSIFLDRLTTITDEPVTASDFALFGRGILTINPDGDGKRSFPEYVSFTGIDQTERALTGAIRGLSSKSNTVVEENKRYHPAGTRVAITFGTHDISDLVDYFNNEIAALTLGSNQVVTGIAGETITAGQVVYLKDDAKWWLARADQTATIYNVQLGIAQGAGVTDASITNGILRLGNDTNQTGLTTGTTMYVSDTPGAISVTAGTNERVVGVARGTDNLYFDPNYRFNGATEGGGDFGTPSSTNKFLTEDWVDANSGETGNEVLIKTKSNGKLDQTIQKSFGSMTTVSTFTGNTSGELTADEDLIVFANNVPSGSSSSGDPNLTIQGQTPFGSTVVSNTGNRYNASVCFAVPKGQTYGVIKNTGFAGTQTVTVRVVKLS